MSSICGMDVRYTLQPHQTKRSRSNSILFRSVTSLAVVPGLKANMFHMRFNLWNSVENKMKREKLVCMCILMAAERLTALFLRL